MLQQHERKMTRARAWTPGEEGVQLLQQLHRGCFRGWQQCLAWQLHSYLPAVTQESLPALVHSLMPM